MRACIEEDAGWCNPLKESEQQATKLEEVNTGCGRDEARVDDPPQVRTVNNTNLAGGWIYNQVRTP